MKLHAKHSIQQILIVFAAFLLAGNGLVTDCSAEDWNRFRGPNGSGVSTEPGNLPTEFSETKNVKWKTPMPGAGASGPIVVGDKIFVACYSGYGQSRSEIGEMDDLKRHLVCVSRNDGNILWTRDVDPFLPEDPFRGMGVPEHGYASSTPVSDGEHVFVFFGKSGVIAFDLEGNEKWRADVGNSSGRMRWGSGASPILHENVLVVNASEESAAMVGLDKATGKEIWKAEGFESVWGTPIVMGEGKDAVVVISVPGEVWALNPTNGKLRWYTTNGIDDGSVSSSMVASDDVVITMGGRSKTAVAVRVGGRKDVTESNTVWKGTAVGRITTPVVAEGRLYSFTGGFAACIDAKTGEEIYRERMPSSGGGGGRRGPSADYASPVLGDGKIYQFAKDGTCHVVQTGTELKILATNRVDDGSEFNATPAISNGELIVRSNKFLYAFKE